jgi:hypothetical protein
MLVIGSQQIVVSLYSYYVFGVNAANRTFVISREDCTFVISRGKASDLKKSDSL